MKTLLRLSLFVVIACLGLFFISHYLFFLSLKHTLSQPLANYHYILMLWRYSFYALLFFLWPHFIMHIGERQRWPSETIVYLSNQRLKLLALFLIFEIFFVFNILGKLLGYL